MCKALLIATTLMLLSRVKAACNANEVRLYALRVEERTVVYFDFKGSSEIPPGESETIRLFGCGMKDVNQVIFTANSRACPGSGVALMAPDIVGPFDIDPDESRSETFTVEVVFPKAGYTYYLCLGIPSVNGNGTTYFHQNITSYLTIVVKVPEKPEKYYLPLPVQIVLIAVLLMLTAIFSGLNLGLMALDLTELQIILKSGTPLERKYATKIIPVRKTGNYLLCTLLFGNVIVNSAISILFDNLTTGFIALVASSLAIVILGEIIPQSICSRYGLAVGAKTIWVTKFFMVLTFPLSFPISKLLDLMFVLLVGEVYTRERLLELIRLSKEAQFELQNCQEVAIVSGALELSKKTVKDVMTLVDDIYMICSEAVLDTQLVGEIIQHGYTRIPVYGTSRNDILGLLNVKDLALLDPDDNITVKAVCAFYQHAIRFVFEDMPLNSMLEEFKAGNYHMAYVRRIVESSSEDNTYEIVGLVTLEDIIEEIFQFEILDETDVVTDNRRKLRRKETRMRDLSYLMRDSSTAQVSPQLVLATMQHLSTTFEPFSNVFFAENMLQKLIRQNTVQVLPLNGTTPKLLYEKDKPADYFVLILEGRVDVIFGDENLLFEAGPFFSFGKPLLDKWVRLTMISQDSLTEAKLRSVSFTPDYSVRITDKVLYLLVHTKTYSEAHGMCLLAATARRGSEATALDVTSIETERRSQDTDVDAEQSKTNPISNGIPFTTAT